MVCLKGEIVITIRPYDTLYLLRSETHLNKDCTVLEPQIRISNFGSGFCPDVRTFLCMSKSRKNANLLAAGRN